MSLLRVEVACGSTDEASRLSIALLEARLIACAQTVPITSRYWWDSKIETSDEVLLIMKTTSEQFEALSRKVQKLHSYDVPEITATEIVQASRDYADWIRAEVKG